LSAVTAAATVVSAVVSETFVVMPLKVMSRACVLAGVA
jgi:hypothetical protein